MSTKTTGTAEVRNTKQRRAVTGALQGLEDFISTQELHRLLRDRGQSVSLATTYRILQSLGAGGLVPVRRMAVGVPSAGRGAAHHHHHHVVCRSCGAAVELEAPDVETWAEETARRYGYADVDHTVEISGICAECGARGRVESSDARETAKPAR